MRSAEPRPFGRDEHAEPVGAQLREPAAERVGVADDRIERGRGERRRIGIVGSAQHRHGLRLRVREQPVERQRQPRRGLEIERRTPRLRQRSRERGLFVEQLLGAVAQAASARTTRRSRSPAAGRAAGARRREPRQPRLHAVEGLAFRQPLPLLRAPRLRLQQLGRPRLHLFGGEQLAHRKEPRLVDVDRSSADRRPRTARADRPRRPRGRCAPGWSAVDG